MKIRDFQFIRSFAASNGTNIDLDIDVNVIDDGKTDFISTRGKSIEIHSPSSISRTLFNLTYRLVEKEIESPHKKDLFALALSENIHDYIYRDEEDCFENTPPIVMSGKKSQIVNIIIKEIIEPVIDEKIELAPIFVSKCTFSDPCRIILSRKDLPERYGEHISFSRYPLILCNSNIKNRPSLTAALLIKQLELATEKKSEKIIKNLLLNEQEDLLRKVVKVLSTFEQDAEFVEEFLSFLKTYCTMSVAEEVVVIEIIASATRRMSKYSQKYNSDVQIQWTNFPMMMGIIEKQLGGSRGSKRELSELMKEIDQEKLKLKNRAMKKKKRTLNMEDLLKLYREFYQTKIHEPGKLCETLLQDVRNW